MIRSAEASAREQPSEILTRLMKTHFAGGRVARRRQRRSAALTGSWLQ